MDNEIKEMFGVILNKLNGIELRMDKFELRMNKLDSRQDEIFLVVKATEHNNTVHGAEIDNIKFKVHHLDGTFNAIGEVITSRKAV
ncbi:MAG TPA: M domain protein [Desulfosporosinus sp.]